MGELVIPVQWMPVRAAGDPAAGDPAAGDPVAGGAGGAGLGFASPVVSCRLVAELGEEAAVAVIGIRGPGERGQARLAIRAAIADALSALSGLPPHRIVLHAEPGEAPWALLELPADPRRAWLAISHDGELSVAAISLHGPVGIDVTRILDIPDWEAVARDYLGPETAARLAALPATARAPAFARAWTEREARLKYLGRELTEWRATGDRALASCPCLPLVLPEGYVGALALPY